jgi:hypothetical protein
MYKFLDIKHEHNGWAADAPACAEIEWVTPHNNPYEFKSFSFVFPTYLTRSVNWI